MAMRIITTSDRDLRTLAAIGQFRQDLCARLSAVEISVPPLRERAEDIPELAEWLLGQLADAAGQNPKVFADEAIMQLQGRLWPGNMRELERVVALAAGLAEGGVIEPRHLLTLVEAGPATPRAAAPERTERLHDVMQRHVLEVLTRCGGNKVRAAVLLGISRSTLYRMLGAESVSCL
jgi:DNA-binding NtrC family response regulator